MTAVVPTLVNTLVTATVLLMGGLKVMDGELTVGLLVAYQSLTGNFTRPLNNFVNFGSMLQELEADMNRLDDVLRYPQDKLYRRAERQDERRQPAQAAGQGRAEGRHLRLQPTRAAADRELRRSPSSPASGWHWWAPRAAASRRCRSWWPGSTSRGRARCCSTTCRGTRCRAGCSPTRSAWSTRRSSFSAARSRKTSPCGTAPSPPRR